VLLGADLPERTRETAIRPACEVVDDEAAMDLEILRQEGPRLGDGPMSLLPGHRRRAGALQGRALQCGVCHRRAIAVGEERPEGVERGLLPLLRPLLPLRVAGARAEARGDTRGEAIPSRPGIGERLPAPLTGLLQHTSPLF